MNKQKALAQYYRFTPEDLEQNKQGIVSENQKKEVLRRQRLKAVKSLIVLALVVLVLAAYIGFNLVMGGTTIKIPSHVWVIFFFVPAVIAGIIVSPVFKKRDLTLKSAHGKVQFVRVIKKERDNSRSDSHTNWTDPNRTRVFAYWEMHVGDESFCASDKLREIVHQGDICRVYYTVPADIISMEILLQ